MRRQPPPVDNRANAAPWWCRDREAVAQVVEVPKYGASAKRREQLTQARWYENPDNRSL
jgi:hypothetical protein